MKATIEEVEFIENFAATVDGLPVVNVEPYHTDPLALRYEVNFRLPRGFRRARMCLRSVSAS